MRGHTHNDRLYSRILLRRSLTTHGDVREGLPGKVIDGLTSLRSSLIIKGVCVD